MATVVTIRRFWGAFLALGLVVALAGTAVAGARAPGGGAGTAAPAAVAAPRPQIPPPAPADAPLLPGRGAPSQAAPPEEPAPAPAVGPAPDPAPDPADPPPPPAPPEAASERILVPAPARLAVFAGLSTWIDLYDELAPEEQVARAAAGGAQAIFVQSARFNSPADVHDPARLAAVIERAHDHGLRVMVWYIPDHVDPAVDLRRSQAAIAFTTPRGDRADGFGLDIELETVTDIAQRTDSLLAVSAALRQWVGPDYPMAAIVLPPLQLERRRDWWPNFPYAALRPYYDVYIPMSYSSYRGKDYETTYNWNFRNVVDMRTLTGDPDLPVHLAGGIADNLPAVDAFVDAARDGKVIGGGLYDLETTPPTSWEQLRRLRRE
jgi:hypothetical protein